MKHPVLIMAVIVVSMLAVAVTVGVSLLAEDNACVIGDVRARMAAHIPDHLRDRHYDAGYMRIGLGSAATDGWSSLGDAIAVGGKLWLRNTQRQSLQFFGLSRQRRFQSNAFVYIPFGVYPKSEHVLLPKTTLTDVWQELAEDHPKGVLAAGYVKFTQAGMLAIAKPPISGINIAENIPYYYTQPMEYVRHGWVYIVSVVANAKTVSRQNREALIHRMIPQAQQVSMPVWGYAHGLRLKRKPVNLQVPPRAENVTSIGQLAKTAVVKEGRLQLYPLTRPGVCEAKGTVAHTVQ